MRRVPIFTILALIAIVLPINSSFGAEATLTSTLSASLQSVFSGEFYTDENVVYSDAVPFSEIDPTKTMVYPDGRTEDDGKSDTAIICRSNMGVVWYLKLHLTPNAPLTAEKVKYYISQPWNRNTGDRADGSLGNAEDWIPFNITPTTVYSAGATDQSNLPFGTLVTFSFSLLPQGLEYGQVYTASISYTLTTAQ